MKIFGRDVSHSTQNLIDRANKANEQGHQDVLAIDPENARTLGVEGIGEGLQNSPIDLTTYDFPIPSAAPPTVPMKPQSNVTINQTVTVNSNNPDSVVEIATETAKAVRKENENSAWRLIQEMDDLSS